MPVKTHMTHEEKRERREKIADAVRRGDEISDIAQAFKVSIYTVYNACKEFGVALPDRRTRAVSA